MAIIKEATAIRMAGAFLRFGFFLSIIAHAKPATNKTTWTMAQMRMKTFIRSWLTNYYSV